MHVGKEQVVDVWGGHADAARTSPWDGDTLVNLYSVGKAISAVCALRLVNTGTLDLSSPVLAQRGVVLDAKGDRHGIEGANGLRDALGSHVTEYVSHPAPIPVGFWRSVGASLNTFGVESMIDELAAAAPEKDRDEFRRDRGTDARWVAALDAVTARHTGVGRAGDQMAVSRRA